MNSRLILVAAVALHLVAPARSVESRDLLSQMHPYISVSGKYSTNVALSPIDEKSDFITSINPGLKFSNMDQASGMDLDYMFGVVRFGRNSDLNHTSHHGSLFAKYLTTEHVNFYLRESFVRSDEQREREFFTTDADNKYVLATNKVRSVYWRNVVSPTLEYRFGPENRVAINYRNNLFRTQSADSEDSDENYINPSITYWFDKRNGITLDYEFTHGSFQKSPGLTAHRTSGRYTNRFKEAFSFHGAYSYSTRSFKTPNRDYDIHETQAGLTYNPTPWISYMVQAGYYRTDSDTSGSRGLSYSGSLQNNDPRTRYQVSFQGGYTEDYFTGSNLGFKRYHRFTGSLTHALQKYTSIGLLGSVSRADFTQARKDTTWAASLVGSHRPLEWLVFSLNISHLRNISTIRSAEYSESSAMLTITATY